MTAPGRAAFSVLALAVACSGVPRLAASGRVAAYPFRGTVDHGIARDYLEGGPLPPELDALRRRVRSSDEVPTRAALAEIAGRYSPDVATLLFVEALGARADVRELRASYERELSIVRRHGPEQSPPRPPSDLLVLMVPGWFYVSHGRETNADFQIQRSLYERWGIAHRLVPIDENGAIEDNARIIAAAVRGAAPKHRIFLVSASKSGAEVALAIARELSTEDAGRIVGWLSIVGTVRGSPLADEALDSALCPLIRAQLAMEGFDLSGLRSLRATRARSVFDSLQFPASLRIFSLIAVPLSGQISERAALTYGQLRALGPNDGLTLLADEIIPGSVPLLLSGKDHYLGPGDQRDWSTALFRVLLGELPDATRTSSSSALSKAFGVDASRFREWTVRVSGALAGKPSCGGQPLPQRTPSAARATSASSPTPARRSPPSPAAAAPPSPAPWKAPSAQIQATRPARS